MGPLRTVVAKLWHRSGLFRQLRALSLWPKLKRDGFDLAHLSTMVETTLGPLQRDEATMLYGMVRVTRPATVVEFGFYSGQSAYNFLRAMDPDARIYSFDVDPNCANTARLRFGGEPRLKLILKPMEEFEPDDVDGRPVDFVFIDGSHDFEGTCETFRRLMPVLAPDAIVAVHDTGTLPRRFFPDGHPYLEEHDRWVDDEYEGEPGERAFVNWILDEHPEFAQLHLHSRRVHRAGITVLQRTFRLKRPPGAED